MEQKQKLKNIYHALEFDEVARRVLAYCSVEDSEEHFYTTRPSFDAHTVRQMQQRVQEISRRSTYKPLPSFQYIPTFKNTLLHIRKKHLHLEEISILCTLVDSIIRFHRWIEETQNQMHMSDKKSDTSLTSLFLFPHIAQIVQLHRTLTQYFDKKGNIDVDSIPPLKKIYHQEATVFKKRTNVAKSYIKNHSAICSSSEATVKDNRLVIPIKSSYKNYSKGVIHSTSNSEHTIFFELEELYEYNNQIEILNFEKEKIIQDICRVISEETIKIIEELSTSYASYIEYDTTIAQHLLSAQYKGIFPIESSTTPLAHKVESYTVHLPQVSHLLINNFSPITIDIPHHSTQLILTGPNAGGKTIALKTLGLTAAMNQSGIPVPVSEGAVLPIFNDIIISIGDHQDITTGQSTFSSHVYFIHDVLPKHASNDTNSSLLLFDELCTGTDEQEGGALAWAILEYLQQFKNYITVITTHSYLLKHYAIINDGVEIAALEHKRDHYRILYGSAGDSEAAILAKEIGLPEPILRTQSKILQKFGKDSHELLKKLHELIQDTKENHVQSQKKLLHIRAQEEKLDLQEKTLLNKEIAIKNSNYYDSSETYAQLHTAMERVKQKDIKLNALITTLHTIIKKLKTPRNEELLQSLWDSPANDNSEVSIETLTQCVHDIASQLSKEEKAIKDLKTKVHDTMKALSVGEEVIVLSTGMKGTVIKTHDKNIYTVRVGILNVDLERRNIQNIDNNIAHDTEVPTTAHVSVEVEKNSRKLSHVIDVRALSVQEAMQIITTHLDTAVLLHQKSFGIIHGKGHGILAKSIHEMLKTNALVSKYYFATPEDGGHGKTYVEL